MTKNDDTRTREHLPTKISDLDWRMPPIKTSDKHGLLNYTVRFNRVWIDMIHASTAVVKQYIYFLSEAQTDFILRGEDASFIVTRLNEIKEIAKDRKILL